MSNPVNLRSSTDYPFEWVDRYSKHSGPCLVLGNGPSTKELDTILAHPKMMNAITIGTNAIGLMHAPHFYLITDPRAWDWYYDTMMEATKKESILLMGRMLYNKLMKEGLSKPLPANTYLLGYDRPNVTGVPTKFGPIYHGRTVGMIALGLAFQFGFKQTYMLGVDGFGCKSPDTHFHNEHKEANDTVVKADQRDTLVAEQLKHLAKAYSNFGMSLRDLSTISVWDGIIEKEVLS